MKIFQFQDEVISTDIFLEKLSPFIQKGDTVYVELDLMKFGKLYDSQIKKNDLLHQIFLVFFNLVGESGNILVPSFSYSWGQTSKEKLFDVKKTRSWVGIFPEYLRKMDGTLRTLDPMFSSVSYGKERSHFVDTRNSSFGQGSLFHKMHEINAKLVSFGLKQFDPTFVHYVEEYFDERIAKIGYRFLRTFEGELIDYQGKRFDSEHYAFMRHLDSDVFFDDRNLTQALREKNKLSTVQIGNGTINISDCESVFQAGIEGLKENRMFFVKQIDDRKCGHIT
ncbi:AAC(3) family N-acetyltransferase [Acidobacteria bacterium AH-259-D05]|nr:AAC(3) family N-acetyltransferase [Acidobacteria bacterium AH-259-D05]